ncbi:hypothetical protein MTR67_047612 [Solanum verrucosum]|uniref:Uncharacterized protein n=1 Tax=Solanum verrucosum TaxID=315347 RepID=A0AAF0ZVS0_SOLVR|nr:hypothetical protein MTR67_047612 [Solanum verrucosum]
MDSRSVLQVCGS